MHKFTQYTKQLGFGAVALVAAAALPQEASATYSSYEYYYYSTVADPGTFSPVSLGDTVTLDACGSTFLGYSICSLSDLSAFNIEWLAWDATEGLLGTLGVFDGADASDGLNVQINTGAGSFFDSPGTYYVQLDIEIDAYQYVSLPNGGYSYTGYYGARDATWSDAFSVSQGSGGNPTPVPEPAGMLLMLPGLAYIARRSRKRKDAAKA